VKELPELESLAKDENVDGMRALLPWSKPYSSIQNESVKRLFSVATILYGTRDLDRYVFKEDVSTSHMNFEECATGTKAFLHTFVPH
jgi:hypothetical protein